MIYQWKQGARVSIEAQAAGEELERIRTRHNGRLESETVVAAARSPENPLHPAFEWDDTVAAHSFRVEQAKYVIRSIEVTVEPEPEHKSALQEGRPRQPLSNPIRAFVSVVRDEDRSYTSVSHAMADPDLRRQVLLSALAELEAWRKRHAELIELANVFVAIEEARGAV